MSSGTRTVLVVDDEASIRRCLKRVLERDGFSVVGAATGEEALEALGAGPVDVVLLDCAMPDGSGPELVPRLRAARAGIPILFHTGSEVTAEDRSLVEGVLPKPASAEELSRMLHGITG
ncbi:MAG: response regulator [Archangium sp.]|nr:response regulator [Archangium sp.]